MSLETIFTVSSDGGILGWKPSPSSAMIRSDRGLCHTQTTSNQTFTVRVKVFKWPRLHYWTNQWLRLLERWYNTKQYNTIQNKLDVMSFKNEEATYNNQTAQHIW